MTESKKIARIIRCPSCGRVCSYSEENQTRPFCSDRCQRADTAAWATESYRIPTENLGSSEDQFAGENELGDSEVFLN